MRPAVLITDAYNALNNQPQRKQRDQEFIGKFLINSLCYLRQSFNRQIRDFAMCFEFFWWWPEQLPLHCFADMILKVLRADGNVLLPVETAGRVLELILHLESVSTEVVGSPLYR